jgi:type I restriction enzyme S subunit
VNQVLVTEPSAYITEEGFAGRSAKWIPSGALVMALAGQGKTKGTVAQLGITTTCNQSMAAVVPDRRVTARFLFWWLSAHYDTIRNLAGGEQRDGLNLDILGSFPVPLFAEIEQAAIADFLDRKTAETDALVTKKLALIEKLKESRSALVSRTVTRGLPYEAARAAGLDTNPKMKPSGIEWLGDVPKHWKQLPFKRLCSRVDVGIAEAATHAYCDDGIPIIRSTNVRPNLLDGSEILRIEPWFAEKNRSKTLRAGDLVTVRTGYPGTTAVIPKEYAGSQCFTLVMSSLKDTEVPEFFCYFFNADPGMTYFKMEGWGTAQTNISVPIVQYLPVLRPPASEQSAIVAFLDRETAKIDSLVAKVEQAIERLQEYRTALITAAVTGKIDVRQESGQGGRDGRGDTVGKRPARVGAYA